MTIDKTYRPDQVEDRLYSAWESAGAFACGCSRPEGPDAGAKPFTIVIPPPNVTGSLHMGHALNNTLQDILIRYNRLRGRDALWQPGTDHAGIATQMMVERDLALEQKTRHDLGRDKFIERVWTWKAESGGTITRQLRRLGASCDWSRERFTMDDGLSAAVRHVFVSLHKEGLLYRDKRLVNWDPKLHTAISDLEVDDRDEPDGKMWHFKYPIEGEDGATITVATTRPETMLGDTAVAVHPEDDRYCALVGKNVILPIVGRRIPIVADEYSDPEKGSGAVKITPAHDFNDFEVGKRHDLPMVSIFDESAVLNDEVPEPYRGLERFVAREKVIAEMDSLGLLEKIEPNPMTIPYGDRSGVVVEPRLTDQWFVDAATLAKPAIEAVESGKTRFVPKQHENTFFNWMRNIQPWCISRQIWWGHQIPAWYGEDGTIFVEHTEEEALAAAEAHYGKKVPLTRDPDVLDTWFSSALWPFSTLGWPEKTPEVERYYPNSVLVTAYDIIFFWVARMMMMGLHFMKEVPFETVFIHGLVLDKDGKKMSKTIGNVVDPLEQIEKNGADVLRFTLASQAAQGRSMRWSEDRIDGSRYFITKLWNASRFAQMNGCVPVATFDPAACELTVNRWIIGELAGAQTEIEQAIENYRFSDAADAVYHFTWDTFCDWYVEFTKPIVNGSDQEAAAETKAATAWVLDQLLHLLHPFIPFITEELWALLAAEDTPRPSPLINSSWPALTPELLDANAKTEMDWVVRMISEIRTVRSEMNVPPGAKLDLLIKGANGATLARLETHRDLLLQIARLTSAEAAGDNLPEAAAQGVVDEATLVLPLGDVIDLDQERARLQKEKKKTEGEIAIIEKKLGNDKFMSRAPEDVIEVQRERLTEYQRAKEKLEEALKRLP